MGNVKAKTHLEKLGFSETDKKNPTHDKIQTWVYENIEKIISETVMAKNKYPFKISQNKWEHQVMYETKTYKVVVGFIDIMAEIDGTFNFTHVGKVFSENVKRQVFIEVKTEIPSLGELIRQMRTYQSYQGEMTSYLIVSPDDRHQKILLEQGFYFYKYKDPALLF